MAFAGMSTIAIVVAAAASFLVGALWYGILGKCWMAALGKTQAETKGPDGPVASLPFVIGIVSQLVMATVLAGLIAHLGANAVTVRSGVISALFVWVGFVATTLATNHGFQGAKPLLTLIDGGQWLAVLLIQGTIIGAFGV